MYNYDCSVCSTRCDGISKGVYDFKNDVEYSEHFEKQIINDIIDMGYYAEKTCKKQYPDIEVYSSKGGELLCYIEVKAQRRTFMSVEKCLPEADLTPSETLALNQSDLEHYIAQSKTEPVPFYIAWVLSNRPCIVEEGKTLSFYNSLNELEKIFNRCGSKRRFKRRSGKGDVVNGEHKGVVVNYHFSLNELKPFDLDEIINK